VEAICGNRKDAEDAKDTPREIPTFEVLELLIQLVDKSLVVAEEGHAEVRYRLMETIRHYALDKLRETGEVEALRARHAAWFLALARRRIENGREQNRRSGWNGWNRER